MSVWIGQGQGDFVEYISIPFSREEWESIINSIEYYTNFRYGFDEDFVVERNIVDRIQKNLGIE